MLKRKNFRHYSVADLLTAYSFLNDFCTYSSHIKLIKEIEDELIYRFDSYKEVDEIEDELIYRFDSYKEVDEND